MVTAVLMDKASGIGVLPATYYPSKALFGDFLENKGGELITSLTDTQHKAVNHMLTHLYADKNMGSVEASRYLRPLFGLNQPQMRANKNFYDATLLSLLENNPKMSREIGAEKALKKATAYAAKQHRYRATMIARTELANAYNAGHFLATVEAMAIGLLDDDMLKIVCTSDSERRCDSCGVMEGETVPIQEKFSNGHLTPPFHPQCMCTLLYEEKWLHEEFSGGGSENGDLPSGNSSTQGLTSPNNSGTMGIGGDNMNEDRKNPVTGEMNSSPKLSYTSFHTEKKLNRHLDDHLHEYDGFTPEMYVARATELLNTTIDGINVDGFTDDSGFLFRYEESTNDFAIGHCSGAISTLFKPVDGRAYWEEQKRKYEGGNADGKL